MADLIAQGVDSRNRWRRNLPDERSVVLGRAGNWPTPWDDRISRRHVELSYARGKLHVTRLSEARNPVFFKGRACDQFELAAGEHFVIGETTFTLASDRALVSLDVPAPVEEQAFSTEYLHNLPFRRVGPHIDVLGRLPEVISGADSNAELSVRLVNLLLSGLPRAGAAALVARRLAASSAGQGSPIDVLHWDRRQMSADDFHPSERLIQDALERGESVLHVWNASAEHAPSLPAGPFTSHPFTVNQGIDWAFCTPVAGKACGGWALYVAGRFQAAGISAEANSDPRDLRDDLKFTELAATTLGALCDVRLLERQRAGLAQFFAPQVLEAMQGADPSEVLAPREADVTVLFCDLRGFSRASERAAADLFGLLERVSRALGVATHQIQSHGGVLGDFHGDAAMGFWGWPLLQSDATLRAARAALAIAREFAEGTAGRGSVDFQVGIGIAAGRAVAGKIGTADQVKVTVFGPVVNLAARLEGLTKPLHASILVDSGVAAALRGVLPEEEGRLRRVAVVRPYGMQQAVEVVQLVPGGDSSLTRAAILDYEQALEAFIAGDWAQAAEHLHRVPASDRVKDFLTLAIAQHDRQPPAAWDGVITLTSK